MQPIWKDYYINLGANSARDYEVQVDGAVIFSGRAYLRPDEDTIKVKINDIAADYLAHLLPPGQGFTPFAMAQQFDIYAGGDLIESVTFYNDWSYDFSFDPETMPLSVPLGALDSRQPLIISAITGTQITATLYFGDGTSAQVVRPIQRTADFNNDFNEDFSTEASSAIGGAAIIDLAPFDNLVSVQVGTITYRVKETCSKYAVYYINAYGGWDSLVLAHGKRTDNLTRHTTKYDYDNSNPSNRGARDYAVEVSPSWELITDWLTCGDKMHHLLNSPFVYLYDLEEQVFIPVGLENTDTEYRERFTNYTFNARLAREQYRR